MTNEELISKWETSVNSLMPTTRNDNRDYAEIIGPTFQAMSIAPDHLMLLNELPHLIALARQGLALAPVAEGKAVIVPVEPTESMIAAGVGVRHLQGTPEAWSMATVNIYRAMIGARG